MTVTLHFYDTSRVPAAPCASWSSPAEAKRSRRRELRLKAMAIPPNSGPSVTSAAALASVGIWRLLAVAAPHLAALVVMLQTEADFGSRIGFLLSWGILNFLWIALWWLDPFRIRRLPALASMLACVAALVGYSITWPDEAWRGYYDDGYLSKFARSGVNAVSDFINYGFMESDAVATERLKVPLVDSCHPAGRRPNIIMIHDESSFDIRQADGIKVPAGYGSHFKSFDGKARKFLAESNGGPSWFTEYNVLAGLSSRSFGRFAYFVTRIASGRVERG